MSTTAPSTDAADPELAPEDIPPRPLRHHLALTIYWLSNTLLWGALLHLGFQTRLGDWFGEVRAGYYFAVIGFVGGIVGTASQIVVGAFSDRALHPWGRRRGYIVVGTMLGTAALILLGAAKSFWPFAGALVLVQLFTNAAFGPFTALLPDTVNPREHGKASGFMGFARLLGDMGGIILAGQLLSVGGPPESAPRSQLLAFDEERMLLMCSLMAAFMFVTMVATCLTIREQPLRRRPDATAWQIVVGALTLDVRGNTDFFWLCLSRAITNVGFYMFLAVMPFFVRYTFHIPRPHDSHMVMMVQLPGIVAAGLSSVASGILSDRIGRRRLIFGAQFVMAGAALTFALAPNLATVFIAVVPGGIAYGVFTAVEWALACNLLPAGRSAQYLGIWNASAVVPQILALTAAGAVGGAISAHVPGLGWRVDFGIILVCCLVGTYFLRHVRERLPAPTAPASPPDSVAQPGEGEIVQ
jgi:MFS family permease